MAERRSGPARVQRRANRSVKGRVLPLTLSGLAVLNEPDVRDKGPAPLPVSRGSSTDEGAPVSNVKETMRKTEG